ncbi:MAG: suppressor of fused domain protein [Planctomycetota bacterium]
MAEEWFIKTKTGRRGPYSAAQLQRYVDSGALHPNAGLSVGDDKWIPAFKIKAVQFSDEALKKIQSSKSAKESARVRELEQQLASLQAELQQQRDEHTSKLQSREQAFASQLKQLELDRQELANKQAEQVNRQDRLQEKEGQAAEALHQAEQQQAELLAERETLAQEQAKFDQQRQELQDRQAELDEQSKALESAAAQSQSERDQFREKLAELDQREKDFEEKRQVFDEQEQQLAGRSEELNARAEQLKQADEEHAATQRELETRATELDERSAELESRAAELESRAAELESRSAELDKREADVQRNEDGLQQQREQLESESSELTARASQLAARSGELDARAADLDAQAREPVSQPDSLTPVPSLAPFSDAGEAAVVNTADAKENLLQEFAERQAELARRESELVEREEELAERERSLATGPSLEDAASEDLAAETVGSNGQTEVDESHHVGQEVTDQDEVTLPSTWEEILVDDEPDDAFSEDASSAPSFQETLAAETATLTATTASDTSVAQVDLWEFRRQQFERRFGMPSREHLDPDTQMRVDVIVYPPSGDREMHTLITNGMSDYPIPMPNGQRSVRAELLLYATQVETHAIEILRAAAKIPFRKKQGLSIGTTGTNEELRSLLSGSNQEDCVYMLPVIESDSKPIHAKEQLGSSIQLFWMLTISAAERKLIDNTGIHKFLPLLEKNKHSVYFDLMRECYVKRKGWFRR